MRCGRLQSFRSMSCLCQSYAASSYTAGSTCKRLHAALTSLAHTLLLSLLVIVLIISQGISVCVMSNTRSC